ncbi:MAG: cobalt-precorrin-6A reductase [Paracoccaceae bacterium]
MILLLAGTNGAREIADGLAQANIPAIASLAGATRDPAILAIPTRSGGFGGASGFTDYLKVAQITAIIDATHAFASRISARTAEIAKQRNIPYLQLLRPEWQPQKGDRWTFLDNEKQAADHIPIGAVVFLATGRQTLMQFDNLTGRRLICRQIDPPDGPFPFDNGAFLVGRPPFSIAEEVALFTRLGIDWLVVKNAGGQASHSKLDAARQLNIPVALIHRPPLLDVNRVETVQAALNWARALP